MKLEHNWSDEDIKKAKAELLHNRKQPIKNNELLSDNNPKSPTIFTWFEDSINSADTIVAKIDGQSSNSGNSFLWIAEDEILNQGCSNKKLIQFKSKDRYKFENDNIRILSKFNYTENFTINGKTYSLKTTHELKIPSKARILLFPIPSDDGKAQLFLGLKFLKNGLHETNDIRDLTTSAKTMKEPKTINLPVLQLENKICRM